MSNFIIVNRRSRTTVPPEEIIVPYEVIWYDALPSDYYTCRLKVTKSWSMFDGVWYDDYMDWYECVAETSGIQYNRPGWTYTYAGEGMAFANFTTYGPACTGEGECWEKTYDSAWITANVPTVCPLPTTAPEDPTTWTEIDITNWIGQETWHGSLPHMQFTTSGLGLTITSTQEQYVGFNTILPQTDGAARAMKIVVTLSADYPGTPLWSNMTHGTFRDGNLIGWGGSVTTNNGTDSTMVWQEVGIRGDTGFSNGFHAADATEITWTIRLYQGPIWTT